MTFHVWKAPLRQAEKNTYRALAHTKPNKSFFQIAKTQLRIFKQNYVQHSVDIVVGVGAAGDGADHHLTLDVLDQVHHHIHLLQKTEICNSYQRERKGKVLMI